MIKYHDITVTDDYLDQIIEDCVGLFASFGFGEFGNALNEAIDCYINGDYEEEQYEALSLLSNLERTELYSMICDTVEPRALNICRSLGIQYGNLYQQYSFESDLYGRRSAWLKRQTRNLKSTLRKFARRFNIY